MFNGNKSSMVTQFWINLISEVNLGAMYQFFIKQSVWSNALTLSVTVCAACACVCVPSFKLPLSKKKSTNQKQQLTRRAEGVNECIVCTSLLFSLLCICFLQHNDCLWVNCHIYEPRPHVGDGTLFAPLCWDATSYDPVILKNTALRDKVVCHGRMVCWKVGVKASDNLLNTSLCWYTGAKDSFNQALFVVVNSVFMVFL